MAAWNSANTKTPWGYLLAACDRLYSAEKVIGRLKVEQAPAAAAKAAKHGCTVHSQHQAHEQILWESTNLPLSPAVLRSEPGFGLFVS